MTTTTTTTRTAIAAALLALSGTAALAGQAPDLEVAIVSAPAPAHHARTAAAPVPATSRGTVAKAIQALSAKGFKTEQHVALSTAGGAGSRTLASEEEIPYAASVAPGTDGKPRITGSETVTVGTKVSLTRGRGDLLSIDASDSQLVEMVRLDAGPRLGTVAQPHTEAVTLRRVASLAPGQVLVLPFGGSGPRDRRLVVGRLAAR